MPVAPAAGRACPATAPAPAAADPAPGRTTWLGSRRKRRPLQLLGAFLWALTSSAYGASAAAQQEATSTAAGPADAVLVVGVREVPPFALRAADGAWSGVSVDLWQLVAERLNLQLEWRELTLKDTFAALRANQLDVGVAAISVTPERERSLDFTHPYLVTGLALAWPAQSESAWAGTIGAIASTQFLSAVGTLVLVLLVSGSLVWLAERRANPEQFGNGKTLDGLGAAFWWSAVTMTTVGYGDKAPVTLIGRLIALVWMFASLVIVASLTAAIAASLTTSSLQSSQIRDKPLAELRIAVVAGSVADEYGHNQGARVDAVEDLAAALAAVRAGRVDAALHDAPILKYVVRAGWPDLEVERRLRARDDYAFALRADSPLRQLINPTLLELIAGPEWDNIRARYLGDVSD